MWWTLSSVFALVKSSLDFTLWQWHAYILESVLRLAGCCERVFLYHGENSPIKKPGKEKPFHNIQPNEEHSPGCRHVIVKVRFRCWFSQWTSRPFYVAELTNAFFFSSECTKLLIWPLLMFLLSLWWIFLKPNNCLFHLHGKLLRPHDVGSHQQLPNANGTLRINSKPFTCLTDVEINEGIAHICPWNSFLVNCPMNYGPLKKGEGTY